MSERWIIIGDSTPMLSYVGKIQMTDGQLEEAAKSGSFVVLSEARTLRTMMVPSPSGVIMRDRLTPLSLFREGATIHVKPTYYVWPEGDTLTALLDQIKACEELEVAHRAQEAGLVTAVPNAGQMQ